jgi:hypothetical protein
MVWVRRVHGPRRASEAEIQWIGERPIAWEG